jgi:D-sedoheptulose 7-phosphate isomerase
VTGRASRPSPAPISVPGQAARPAEATGFLYPFLDAEERDPDSLLADLAASARAKSRESAELRRATLDACAGQLLTAAAEIARRLTAGGRIFTFGNGGSSTDAATLAGLFASPPQESVTRSQQQPQPQAQPQPQPQPAPSTRALPAWSLTADQAVLTALGNDVGFDLVFARQLIARARPADVAIAMSTSGSSKDLAAAFREARSQGLYTVGFAGYDGGEFAGSRDVDVCFVVRSQSVHRIQEAQALLGYHLWAAVHEHLAKQEDH